MRKVPEHLKDAAVALVHFTEQLGPAKAAVQNHEHRRQQSRSAIAQKLPAEAMEHAHQRDPDNVVFDEQRIAQARSRAHEHCRDKVSNKRIGETHSGKRRVFGREVLAESKARNDADVKRQVAVVIQHAGGDAVGLVQQRACKHQPHDNGDGGVEEKINNRPAIGARTRAADCSPGAMAVVVNLGAARFIYQK